MVARPYVGDDITHATGFIKNTCKYLKKSSMRIVISKSACSAGTPPCLSAHTPLVANPPLVYPPLFTLTLCSIIAPAPLLTHPAPFFPFRSSSSGRVAAASPRPGGLLVAYASGSTRPAPRPPPLPRGAPEEGSGAPLNATGFCGPRDAGGRPRDACGQISVWSRCYARRYWSRRKAQRNSLSRIGVIFFQFFTCSFFFFICIIFFLH